MITSLPVMPLSPRMSHASLTRPSSLPLPRVQGACLAGHVSELVPPPQVPRDLATPSPVRPRLTRLGQDARAGSLSPAIASVESKAGAEQRKLSDKAKNNKFVKLLDHNIHSSTTLYKQSGISKASNPPSKQFKESKNVPQNSTRVNNNKNVSSTARKTSGLENKPTATRKRSDDKTTTTTTRKESVSKKISKDAGATQKSRPSTKKSQSQAAEPPPASRRSGPGSPAAPRSEVSTASSAPSSQCQQPDLVKFTVSDAAHAAQHTEIDRLERLMESHVAHVSRLERRHAENTAGCEVMSVVLANISQKACLSEKLQREIDQLSNSVDQANLQISLKDEAFKVLEHNFDEKEKGFQDLIASLKENHEESMASAGKKHQEELEKLKKDAQLEIHEMTIKHQEELLELLNKHSDEKTRLEHLHTSSMENIKTRMLEQEAKLNSDQAEEKLRLSNKITELTSQVNCLEENLNNGSDYRVKMAQGKMVNLQQEVDSLKTVLEMRTDEIHDLRTDKVKLEEKLELYDQQQLALRKMSAQVEDLKSQLVCKSDLEQKLVEDNRVLQQMVFRQDTEKKRLSMENEQLSWKMSQSFISGKDLCVLNTPDDSSMPPDCPLSMSYCEGTEASPGPGLPPRFTRGGRPVSAPLTQSMFDDTPNSPRVFEIVEKSESVSWKLEYEAALSSLPPPLPSCSPSPGLKRKVSPSSTSSSVSGSPLALRKCRSSGPALMTQSLDLSLARSHSYTGPTSHTPLCRTPSSGHTQPRAGSIRRKILPPFETLSESTESDESKENSPVTEEGEGDTRGEIVTPAPVDIGNMSDDEVCCEISSSSEIEIGLEEDSLPLGQEASRRLEDLSHSDSPDTEPEVTIRSSLQVAEVTKDDPTLSPDIEADRTLRSELNSGD